MIRRLLATAALALAIAAPLQSTAQAADASWLDMPLTNWNHVGATVPAAPVGQNNDPRCGVYNRPVETFADSQLRLQGWDLIGSYYGGWGVTIALGAGDYDGMCRPWAYNGFVFVNGVYAGSLSPVNMDSRTDGSLGTVTIGGPDFSNPSNITVFGSFRRYTATDALCCPSSTSDVTFIVNTTTGQALVTPTTVSTSPNTP